MLKTIGISYLGLALIFSINEIYCSDEGFSYEEVNDWPTLYPKFCSGYNQSPININDKYVRNKYLPDLDLRDYVRKPLSSVTLTNNGHTVQGTFSEDIRIRGGPLGYDTYKLRQFHFHFGRNGNDGSEHTINGNKYAIEIHFVHTNLKYPDLTTAIDQPDGIVVIAVIGKIGYRKSNPLSFVTDNLRAIVNANQVTTVKGPIDLSKLLPKIHTGFDYYTYRGSLTTPNCNEAVTWVINNQPLKLSQNRLNDFYILRNSEGGPMSGNIRPIQWVNGRNVIYVPAS